MSHLKDFFALSRNDISHLVQCDADGLNDLTPSIPRKIYHCKTEERALRPRRSTEHEPVVIKNKELTDLSSYQYLGV